MQSQYFKCSVAICGYCIGQFRSDILFFFSKKIFSNITFLLLIWEFCIVPSLPRSTQLCACPKTEGKEKKICQIQSVLLTYSLEHGQTPSGQLLKESCALLPTPEAINCEELHFTIHATMFKASLQWLPV